MKNKLNGLVVDSYGNSSWFVDGERHRIDGPAREFRNGHKAWYHKGQYVDCSSQEEFERYIKRLVLS